MDSKNNSWILNVLSDLETFCKENGLEFTSEALAKTKEVAKRESLETSSKRIQYPGVFNDLNSTGQ